jgi:hypothetical protein
MVTHIALFTLLKSIAGDPEKVACAVVVVANCLVGLKALFVCSGFPTPARLLRRNAEQMEFTHLKLLLPLRKRV